MQEYTLRKDTPDLKAGAVFKYCKENGKYHHIEGSKVWSYDKDVVENSPEWFEEKKGAYGWCWTMLEDGTPAISFHLRDGQDIGEIANDVRERIKAALNGELYTENQLKEFATKWAHNRYGQCPTIEHAINVLKSINK